MPPQTPSKLKKPTKAPPTPSNNAPRIVPQRGAAAAANAALMSPGTGVIQEESKKTSKRKRIIEETIAAEEEEEEEQESDSVDSHDDWQEGDSPQPGAPSPSDIARLEAIREAEEDAMRIHKRLKQLREGKEVSPPPFLPPPPMVKSKGKKPPPSSTPDGPPYTPPTPWGTSPTVSNSVTFNNNIGSVPPPSPGVAASSGVPQAQQIEQLLASLASHPDLALISNLPGLTPKLRADVAANRFVPLFNFNPTPVMGATQAMASSLDDPSNADATDAFRQSLANLMEDANPFHRVLQAQKNKNMAPRFKSFENVIMAFFTGLIPLACQGNPSRLADYSTFMTALMMDRAKGNQEWPVYLRYMEATRRKAMLANYASSPAVDAQRAGHKLCANSLSADSILDQSLLLLCGQLWNNRNTAVFEEDHVDPSVLAAMFKEARDGPKPPSASPSSHSAPKDSPAPKHPSSKPSTKKGATHSFSDSEWTKLMALQPPPFCRGFLAGRCTDANCKKAHKSAEKIRTDHLSLKAEAQ